MARCQRCESAAPGGPAVGTTLMATLRLIASTVRVNTKSYVRVEGNGVGTGDAPRRSRNRHDNS
jgi:hypothetical protein